MWFFHLPRFHNNFRFCFVFFFIHKGFLSEVITSDTPLLVKFWKNKVLAFSRKKANNFVLLPLRENKGIWSVWSFVHPTCSQPARGPKCFSISFLSENCLGGGRLGTGSRLALGPYSNYSHYESSQKKKKIHINLVWRHN